MEGLARQETTEDWELIVMECFSPNMVGQDYFRNFYRERLKAAGCVRLKYIYSDRRLPLSAKWKKIYKYARGKFFLLQGSDDYPHASRNQDVWDADVDWFDCRQYYHYEVNLQKLIRFDNLQTNEMISEMSYKDVVTGFNMGIRTRLLGKLPEGDVSRWVDGYLKDSIQPESRYIDQRLHRGVSTNGVNTISRLRIRFYNDVKPPYYPTTETIDTIGLPEHVAYKLKTHNKK